MTQTVIGIFDSSAEAQNAVHHLVSSGISRSNIDIADRSATDSTTSSTNSYNDNDDSIGGFFRNLFGSDDDADRYSTVARRGCTVTVHAQSEEEASRAADLLDDYGAVDVDERAQQYSSGSTGTFNSGSSYTGAMDSDTSTRNNLDTDMTNRDNTTNRDNFNNTDTSIPIIEENLQVGKRVTETGGVRVRSRIVERPVEEHLRLREEHVNIERNPVNRPATEADLGAFQEGTIELTEHAEVPVVNKEARVVEEITLDKDVEERDEVIRDTVRKTEVDVDNLNTTDTRYNTDGTNRTDTETRHLTNPDTDRDTRNNY